MRPNFPHDTRQIGGLWTLEDEENPSEEYQVMEGVMNTDEDRLLRTWLDTGHNTLYDNGPEPGDPPPGTIITEIENFLHNHPPQIRPG